MTPLECAHEQDVLDALASRRWPHRCDETLRAHVVNCVGCADLVLVAGALLGSDDGAAPAHLPPASLVWWRAQLRAREEGARTALRPIRAVQIAALICITILCVLGLAAAAPTIAASLGGVMRHAGAALPWIGPPATEFALSPLAIRGVQLAAGAWLIFAPVAVYLAFGRD